MALRFYTLRMYRPFRSLYHCSIYPSRYCWHNSNQPMVSPHKLSLCRLSGHLDLPFKAQHVNQHHILLVGTPPGFKGFRKRGLFQADKARSRVQNRGFLFQNSEKTTNPKHIQTNSNRIVLNTLVPTSHMLAFYMDIILSPVLHFFLFTKWGTLENLRSLERSNFQWLHPSISAPWPFDSRLTRCQNPFLGQHRWRCL